MQTRSLPKANSVQGPQLKSLPTWSSIKQRVNGEGKRRERRQRFGHWASQPDLRKPSGRNVVFFLFSSPPLHPLLYTINILPFKRHQLERRKCWYFGKMLGDFHTPGKFSKVSISSRDPLPDQLVTTTLKYVKMASAGSVPRPFAASLAVNSAMLQRRLKPRSWLQLTHWENEWAPSSWSSCRFETTTVQAVWSTGVDRRVWTLSPVRKFCGIFLKELSIFFFTL